MGHHTFQRLNHNSRAPAYGLANAGANQCPIFVLMVPGFDGI